MKRGRLERVAARDWGEVRLLTLLMFCEAAGKTECLLACLSGSGWARWWGNNKFHSTLWTPLQPAPPVMAAAHTLGSE